MSLQKIFPFLIGAVLLVIIFYSFSRGEQHYDDIISAHREQVDNFMKFNEESPLPDSLKTDFEGLRYFPINPELKVTANLEKLTGNQTLTLGTSDGQQETYTKFAYANFQLQGVSYKLLLLQSTDQKGKKYLFLPFGDQTNGDQTYGGGRYLDLDFTNKDRMEIDFNRSYNPYCAYNPSFSCPLPPADNRLAISIEAGERNYQ